MFRKNTTFVIGAGASVEFGLPVGIELGKRIKASALLRNTDTAQPTIGDDFLWETVRRLFPQNSVERRRAVQTLRTINEGVHTAFSIDAFIHRHHGDALVEKLGKMLIALEIIKAEGSSSMTNAAYHSYEDGSGKQGFGSKLPNPDDTWIGHFLRILIDDVSDPMEIGKDINIICFNYDRCIEYYLRRSISAAYRISLAVSHDIVKRMNIIHPYGTLGELTELRDGYENGVLPFAAELDPRSLRLELVSENIRTYTEQEHDPNAVERIHQAIDKNNQLIFLGFGFNNQNLDLLRIKGFPIGMFNATPRNIYASGYGISRQLNETMIRRIGNLFVDEKDHGLWERRIVVEYGESCTTLFQIHHMNFAKFVERRVTGQKTSEALTYQGRMDG